MEWSQEGGAGPQLKIVPPPWTSQCLIGTNPGPKLLTAGYPAVQYTVFVI